MQPRLFVVDRDSRYAEWLRRHIGALCPDATVSVVDAAQFARGDATVSWDDCDLLLFAASFGSSPEDPTSQGLERLRQFRANPMFPPVIAIAEDGNELTAVRAIQLGALDYLPKRLLTPDRLKTVVRLAMRRVERRVARRLAKLARTANTSDNIMGEGHGDETVSAPIASDFIPGYTIGDALGESEKAIVYRATSDALGREVAIKISKTERVEGQLLAREYAAVSTLRHPAIVQIYDYGTHAGPRVSRDGVLPARRSQGTPAGAALPRTMHCATSSASRPRCEWCTPQACCIAISSHPM